MQRIMKLALLIPVVVVGLAMGACSEEPGPGPTASPAPEAGMAADFQLMGLDGQTVTLSGLRGSPVLLNFWATWCGPCRAEMPYLQQVYADERWTAAGLKILAVNAGESVNGVEKFLEDNGLTFPVLLDSDQSVAIDYDIRGIPTTYFIDKDGIIKSVKVGSFRNKAEIDGHLEDLVSE